MRHRTRIVIACAAIAAGVGLIPAAPALAHHPVVAGATQCRVDTWSVTWTARADVDRDLTWRITSPAGYAPAGSQGDDLAFTRTVTYPGTQASATETVSAAWSNQATGSNSATVARPPVCPVQTTTTTVPATTTTATTVPATTTTAPAATTTTVGADPTTTICTTGVTNETGGCEPVGCCDEPTTTAAIVETTVAGTLPATGARSDARRNAGIAVALVLGGVAILRIARRRRVA